MVVPKENRANQNLKEISENIDGDNFYKSLKIAENIFRQKLCVHISCFTNSIYEDQAFSEKKNYLQFFYFCYFIKLKMALH